MKITTKLILNVANHGLRQWKCFTLDHLKRPLHIGISYLFILRNNLFVSCTRILLWKKDSMKELCKNYLKIFVIKLRGILHACRKDHFCFYKYFTNQTFTFINSKVVYVKTHLAYQLYYLEKTNFLLSLNIPYRGQTIKLAVGTIAEPLHTWLNGVFRNLNTQNAVRVYLKETDKKMGQNLTQPKRNQLKSTGLVSFQ